MHFSTLEYFLAEEVRTARRFLSSLKIFPSIETLHFETLNKETPKSAIRDLMILFFRDLI
jgi:hypothetical protein